MASPEHGENLPAIFQRLDGPATVVAVGSGALLGAYVGIELADVVIPWQNAVSEFTQNHQWKLAGLMAAFAVYEHLRTPGTD